MDGWLFFISRISIMVFLTYGLLSVVNKWIIKGEGDVFIRFAVLLLYMSISFLVGQGTMEEAYRKGFADKTVICQTTTEQVK